MGLGGRPRLPGTNLLGSVDLEKIKKFIQRADDYDMRLLRVMSDYHRVTVNILNIQVQTFTIYRLKKNIEVVLSRIF